MSVRVAVILNRKGRDVVTVAPDATLSAAASMMADHNVGALVVSADGLALTGIISERDLVRWIAHEGAASLARPVAEAMTTPVKTCSPDSTVDEVMATMTKERHRHIPVVANGALAGIVSIGDVVKLRLDELEMQATALERYVTGTAT
jgi:CBS domain-containing protein